MKFNNLQFAAILVGSLGFGIAVVQKDCRRPYVQVLLPAALAAYTKSNDLSKSSDSEREAKDNSKH